MKATELRLGNFIIGCANHIQQVYLIDHRFKKNYCINDINCDERILEDFFKPTPLTEEWLEKFGFVKQEKKKQNDLDFPHGATEFILNHQSILFLDGKYYFEHGFSNHGIADEYFVKEIKFVHKLQNLYYEIHDKELTIK